MSLPTEQQIRDFVKCILKDADLSSLSSKKVRKTLEEKFATDLTEKKQQIDDILMELISAEENKEEDKAAVDSDEEVRSKFSLKSSSNGFASSSNAKSAPKAARSSSTDSDSDASSQKPRKKQKTTTTKLKTKSAASATGKNNVSSGDEVDDEALARQLHEKELGVRPRCSRKPEKKPKKSANGEKSTKRKGTSLYSQACVLSEELASVMGCDRMARKDVVSRMWQIFKERALIDPKNKQYVICDEQLEKVFKTKKFKAFGMMKILKHHMKDARLVQS